MRFVCEHCGVEHQIRNPAMKARIEQRLQQGVVRLKCQHCDQVIVLTPDKLAASSSQSATQQSQSGFQTSSGGFRVGSSYSDGQNIPITRKAPLERVSGGFEVNPTSDAERIFDESASGTFLLKGDDFDCVTGSYPRQSLTNGALKSPISQPASNAQGAHPSPSRPLPPISSPMPSRPLPTVSSPMPSRPLPTVSAPAGYNAPQRSPNPPLAARPTPPAIPLAAQATSPASSGSHKYAHDFYLCSASGDPRFERFLLGALAAQYRVFAECDPGAGVERTPERFIAEACRSHVVIVPLSEVATHAEDAVLKGILERVGQDDGPESVVPLMAALRVPPEQAPARLRRMFAEVWEVGADIQTICAKLADYLEPGGGGRASSEPKELLAQRLAEAGRQLYRSIENGEPNPQYQAELEQLEQQARNGGLQPGATLSDRYRLERIIAEGATTTAWRAFDRLTQTKVAIQVLQPAILNDAVRREAIFARIASCAHLKHPGIIEILSERLVDRGIYYFVTRYASSGSLGHAVTNGQILKRDAINVLLELSQALTYAHQTGCLHLDLNPESVVIDGSGRLNICDFGLTDLRAALQEGGLNPFARLAYLAPERFDENAVLTPAADVYSLAMLGIFLLYGQPLPNMALRAPDRIALSLDCPDAIRQWLAQSVSFEAHLRPATVEVFIDALRRFAG